MKASDIHPQALGTTPKGLLSPKDFAKLLNVCIRKLKQMQAEGVVPPPLELAPRVARWTHDDYLAVVAKLPRRAVQSEPLTLAQARRQKIERIKAGGSVAV